MAGKKRGSTENGRSSQEDLALLITVNSNYEIGLIQSILEDNNIPYLSNDRESGDYMRIYTGSSIFGTDIFVNKDMFEKARELLSGLNMDALT